MKKYSLIILEDERHNTDIILEMIERIAMFKVEAVAEDGFEAIRLCRSKLPDLFLADIEVPVKNGMCVAKEASELGICVVFTTKVTHMALDAYRIGAAGYLTKPFEFEQFKKVMNDAVILIEGRKGSLSGHNNRDLSAVLKEEYGLTPAEIELSVVILSGCLRDELAERLEKTERAVKSLLQGIYKKTINQLPGAKNNGRSDKYGRLVYMLSRLEKRMEKRI